jgi:hypothetical protein
MPRGYLHGYPATLGGKVLCVGTLTGPTSYVTGTSGGQVFADSSARSIDYAEGSITQSGIYRVYAQPQIVSGAQRWFFRWIVISSGLEAASAANLSGETFTFMAVFS